MFTNEQVNKYEVGCSLRLNRTKWYETISNQEAINNGNK